MMKIRLASPDEADRHQQHRRARHASSATNGHLKVGALGPARRRRGLRPHLRCRRVGRPVDLRSAGAQPRHAVRVAWRIVIPRATGTPCLLATGADVIARGPKGERTIAIGDFVQGLFTNALADDEMVTEVRIHVPPPRSGGAYLKLERKIGDYATAAVAAHLELADDGTIAKAGIALTSVAPSNLKVSAAEAAARRTRAERRPLRGRRRARRAGERTAETTCGGPPVGSVRSSAPSRAGRSPPRPRRLRGSRGDGSSPSRSTARRPHTMSNHACSSSTTSAPAPS